jgi:long-chain acyl-CoA synthetase
VTLARLLRRAARIFSERPALALGDRVIADWRELERRVARLAGGLRGTLRLAPGDRLAVFMTNAPEYVELMYACWYAGLALVPINARLHPRELQYILEHSDSQVLFFSSDLAQEAFSAAAALAKRPRLIEVGDKDFRALAAAEPIDPADCLPDALAWLFYTSGTTGRPKGAMLSHRNLIAMGMSYFIDIDPPCTGALLHAAPLSHGSGLYLVPHTIIGNCQLLPESGGFDAAEVLALLSVWDGVSMFAAPSIVKRIAEHPNVATASLDRLRAIVYGGAPMYLADLKSALARLGPRLAQLYGQGESPMTITGMTRAMIEAAYRANDEAALISAGKPQSVVEVRVADPADRPLATGDAGEILVRGETVMAGYWRNEAASVEALRGGWLHTGDIGAFDERGYLTLKDRSKDLIISGGANIYPREVEDILLQHPAVADVAVIGMPDPEWGERVVAFVVARPGAAVTTGSLDRLCLERIARFKRPREYRIVAKLPRNAYGKLVKAELRAAAQDSQNSNQNK